MIVDARLAKMSDGEKVILYTIKHALPSQAVNLKYLKEESDLPLLRVLSALDGLTARNLITKRNKEYKLMEDDADINDIPPQESSGGD